MTSVHTPLSGVLNLNPSHSQMMNGGNKKWNGGMFKQEITTGAELDWCGGKGPLKATAEYQVEVGLGWQLQLTQAPLSPSLLLIFPGGILRCQNQSWDAKRQNVSWVSTSYPCPVRLRTGRYGLPCPMPYLTQPFWSPNSQIIQASSAWYYNYPNMVLDRW